MSNANKIFTLIPQVMTKVGAIGKNGTNKDDDYSFRTIDDVYDALQPALSSSGVFFVPTVLEATEERFTGKAKNKVRVKLKVKYRIFADDGSEIEAVVYGEAIDESDKATNKALTAAFKYLLIQVFCIAVKGQEDADRTSPTLTIIQEKKVAKKSRITPKATVNKPDMKIPDGKFRGKMLSEIPAKDLKAYVDTNLAAMGQSGLKPPKWFEELRRISGL